MNILRMSSWLFYFICKIMLSCMDMMENNVDTMSFALDDNNIVSSLYLQHSV